MEKNDCTFCENPIDKDDLSNFKEVTNWVHGPKSDGAVLREFTGRVAHEDCIRKIQSGQAADQPAIF